MANDIEVKPSSKRTDPEIARDAVQELECHLSLPSDKIKVIVKNGWVTLEGTVDWQYQKTLAESGVKKLRGVTGIFNKIEVSRSGKPTHRQKKAFVAGQKRLELFYLPTYSPDFNPDEGVWSHLKSQELKAHQATNKEELIKKTHEALKRMAKSPALIRSFFKRCNIT